MHTDKMLPTHYTKQLIVLVNHTLRKGSVSKLVAIGYLSEKRGLPTSPSSRPTMW